MKYIALYSLLVIMLVLTGCPVMTDNPIDQGSCDVPAWLMRKWTTAYGPTQSAETYRIEKGMRKGQFKCSSLDSVGNVKAVYDPVFMSKVANKIFLSARTTEGHYLFELIKRGDASFELKEIDEHTLDDNELKAESSSAEIKKFLEKNKDNEEIYGSSSTYKKE